MDLNVQAFRLVQEVTKEAPVEKIAKRAASRKGGLRGGLARAKSMTQERRREIALTANAARWAGADPVK
jgi:hypothetical protein